MPAIEKFVRIFATTVPAFFPRENPISRNAKPACMNITRQAATTTQIELMPTLSGRTPLLAASKVSAIAAAGAISEATKPSPRARTTDERLIDPPESSATRSLGRAGRTVFRRVSKDRRGGFARRSKDVFRPPVVGTDDLRPTSPGSSEPTTAGRCHPPGEAPPRKVRHVDKVLRPPRP